MLSKALDSEPRRLVEAVQAGLPSLSVGRRHLATSGRARDLQVAVPTLRDLLARPDQRPKAFYRGYDVFDPIAVPESSHFGLAFIVMVTTRRLFRSRRSG